MKINNNNINNKYFIIYNKMSNYNKIYSNYNKIFYNYNNFKHNNYNHNQYLINNIISVQVI